MPDENFLLVIDGSAESYAAARTAWSMTEHSQCNLNVIHVVDTSSAWKFLAPGAVGIIGSGPYIAAYENMCEQLRNVGDAIVCAYESFATGHNAPGRVQVVEGDSVSIISEMAAACSLLIIGEARVDQELRPNETMRSKAQEEIMQRCSTPFLLIHRQTDRWLTMRILLGHEFPSARQMTAMMQMARQLALPVEICCYTSKKHHADCTAAVQALSRTVEDLAHAPLMFRDCDDLGSAWSPRMTVQDTTLLLVPTIRTRDKTAVSVGTEIGKFLHASDLPSVLLWPLIESTTGSTEANESSQSCHPNKDRLRLIG